MPALRSLSRIIFSLAFLPVSLVSQTGPGYQPIATATQQILPDRLVVRVYVGDRLYRLPRFRELVVVTPLNHRRGLERLVEKSIVLVPSKIRAHEWSVYAEVQTARLYMPVSQKHVFGGKNALALPENVYTVRGVLVSSSKGPVKVSADGQTYRLKIGEALLVLD